MTGPALVKKLAEIRQMGYHINLSGGYSSVGERSVRIRKAVGSNPIISIVQAYSLGKVGYADRKCVCSSVDRAPDSGSGCAGSTPVRRGYMMLQYDGWSRCMQHFLYARERSRGLSHQHILSYDPVLFYNLVVFYEPYFDL